MKKIDLSNVEAMDGTFNTLPAGGYVCRIVDVKDEAAKEYLKIEFDIAEGEFAEYYRELFVKKDFWGGRFIRSYKESALGFFAHFINCVTASNKGFAWNDDESKLKNKQIGLVLSEEEYHSSAGDIKTRLYVSATKTVDDIRKGAFKVADKKLLAKTSSSELKPVTDETLPF